MPRISKLVCGRVKTCTQIIHLQGLNHYARLLMLEYANSGVEFNMFEFPIYLKFFKKVESTTVLTCIDCTSYSTLPRGFCFEGRILENLSASEYYGPWKQDFQTHWLSSLLYKADSLYYITSSWYQSCLPYYTPSILLTTFKIDYMSQDFGISSG